MHELKLKLLFQICRHFHTLCFITEQFSDDFISPRSGFVDDEEDDDLVLFDTVEARDGGVEQSFKGEISANVAVRKNFPEAWIFDGGLSLGYKLK